MRGRSLTAYPALANRMQGRTCTSIRVELPVASSGSVGERGESARRAGPCPVANAAHMTPEQAAILLVTSRAFLRAHDQAALAREIGAALDRIVRPWKWTVAFIGEDGRLRIVAADGLSEAELARIRGQMDRIDSMAARIVAGAELWSDADDDARGRIAAYQARSGFAVPIVGESGVVGTFSAM